MRDILSCALRELWRRKGRTIANILGYFLVIAIMVVLANVLLFTQSAKNKILNNLGTHFLAYIPGVPVEK